VTKHQFGSSCAQFEKSYKFQQHDHFICLDKGEELEIKEFCDPRIQEIKASVEKLLGVEISHHSLTFYGRCHDHKDLNKEEELN